MRKYYWVVPALLTDAASKTATAQLLNPAAAPGARAYYVCLTRSHETDVPELNCLGPRKGVVKSFGVQTIEELRSRHAKRWGALARQDRLIQELRARPCLY